MNDFRQPFKPAIEYLKQKIALPTHTYRDIEGRANDRSFVVAGALKEALLADLLGAIIQGEKTGTRTEEFAKNFDKIVAKNGWTGWTGENSKSGRAWRARTIYETNLRTSYAAGRYKQMTDPDMVKVRPYWQYRHGLTRRPKNPRLDHKALDGLVLACDDPMWDKIYPPNGWNCSCGVVPLSQRQLERMGKNAPDPSPRLPMRKEFDSKTGEMVEIPQGIALGWDHAPGKDWASGLIPPELQKPLRRSHEAAEPLPDLIPLKSIARPSKAGTLPEGKQAEFYVDAVMAMVGAKRGADGAKLIRDAAGHGVVISDKMFKTNEGNWKVFKRERAQHLLKAFEALVDPDEIWVDWHQVYSTGKVFLRRRYVRFDPKIPSVGVFEWGADGWLGTTSFPVDDPSERKRENYINNQRRGALLWRRPKS